ncbi:endoglucanase 5 [Beta vulgaris subsp. vulgaris]|uniref:endoglucanase 5 n=1 Tax=Beta vulgaris subsp. vulgaris TaxID=3555 RepID=UPI0025489FAB|nr:endoglucanase 5 [Beta vulgaris subsp. vulgaris]
MGLLRLCSLLLVALQLYDLVFSTPSVVAAAAATFDYRDALEKSLLFFEGQRSGTLPWNQRVKWRADSGLKDGFSEQADLVGGYYDAGDNVKFGLPMAFSVTLISWAAVDFKADLAAANQMEHTLQAIQWGTDYFLKAHCQHNALWVQVGDGEADHSCWERAEDMTTPRTAYKVDSGHPGSDVAGETAAALAAASLAFQPFNSSYSTLLLRHAKELFSLADTFRGQYDDSIPEAESFYPSTGYSDELLWAAAWLYRATNNNYYLQYASYNAADLGGTGNAVKMFSWDNKYAGLQVLLAKVLLDGDGQSYTKILKQYKAKADFFACAYLQKNNDYNVPMTPGGLAFLLASNNLQYAASASFLLAIYSTYLTSSSSIVECPDGDVQPQDLLNFAKSQADYILGKNPESMSYLVGYGTKYPTKVHHRGSSMPSIHEVSSKIECVQGFEEWYKNSGPNPNVLYGALIGGPDSSDCFADDRDNHAQSEPTLTAASPLIGLFSKLYSVSSSTYSSSGNYDSPITPSQNSPTKSPPLPKKPSTEEDPLTPPTQPTETPDLESTLAQHVSAPAPAPGPDYMDAPAPSPEVADYVLITQPINSAAPARSDLIQHLVLKTSLFLIPLLAII